MSFRSKLFWIVLAGEDVSACVVLRRSDQSFQQPEMSSFSGKVVAITGAASGMGLATAQLLASRGATISLADLNSTGLETAVASLQPQTPAHMFTVVDVRKTASVNAWIHATVEKLGQLDGAVNMAGVITPAVPLTELGDEAWDFVTDVNSTGVMRCLRAELRAMKEGGSIVSASSTFGQFGAAGNVAYCASKAAVIAMSRTAAKENPGVRINCVAPGMLQSRTFFLQY